MEDTKRSYLEFASSSNPTLTILTADEERIPAHKEVRIPSLVGHAEGLSGCKAKTVDQSSARQLVLMARTSPRLITGSHPAA